MRSCAHALIRPVRSSSYLGTGMPRFYIAMLSSLEDYLVLALKDKDAQKKMSGSNGRALNRMKLALRRHNKLHEDSLASYREAPDKDASGSDSSLNSSESSSESDDSESEEEAEKKDHPADLSDEWASSGESSSDEEEEEISGELKGRVTCRSGDFFQRPFGGPRATWRPRAPAGGRKNVLS
jgi:hypothetical protein